MAILSQAAIIPPQSLATCLAWKNAVGIEYGEPGLMGL
jgi:hypothetical protein